jgi:hypothetical protein
MTKWKIIWIKCVSNKQGPILRNISLSPRYSHTYVCTYIHAVQHASRADSIKPTL